MYIPLPPDVKIDIYKVLRKFPYLRDGEISATQDLGLQITGDWPITYEDLIDCIADPPGPPPPTVEERTEAAELMIDLLLDTHQESA